MNARITDSTRPCAAMRCLALAAAACACSGAMAQSAVTLYGTVDQYLNYMHSSSGATVKSLEDGAFLRSRFGVRGTEDLGGGYTAKFQLEGGLNADNGTTNDTTRFFDRQTWVGIATPVGEFRAGRQNGPIFTRGGYVDYTTRTAGSIVNHFGVPSRFDNDLAYLSPRVGGVMVEAHVALPEVASTSNRQAVYQGAVEYADTQYRLGYMGLRAAPPAGSVVDRAVVYHNAYANWMYGKGTVYLAVVRSNNSTSTALANNAGTILGNVGGVVAGTNTDANRFYNIYQISADYLVTPALRVGALWGRINDTSNSGHDASGGSVGAYYDLSKRTMLYTVIDTLKNDTNAGFRLSGSGAVKTNFTSASDVNGQRLSGAHVGILHRF
jgi:predicted porin